MKTCKWCLYEYDKLDCISFYSPCWSCSRWPRAKIQDNYCPITFNEEGHSNEEEVIVNEEEK